MNNSDVEVYKLYQLHNVFKEYKEELMGRPLTHIIVNAISSGIFIFIRGQTENYILHNSVDAQEILSAHLILK